MFIQGLNNDYPNSDEFILKFHDSLKEKFKDFTNITINKDTMDSLTNVIKELVYYTFQDEAQYFDFTVKHIYAKVHIKPNNLFTALVLNGIYVYPKFLINKDNWNIENIGTFFFKDHKLTLVSDLDQKNVTNQDTFLETKNN